MACIGRARIASKQVRRPSLMSWTPLARRREIVGVLPIAIAALTNCRPAARFATAAARVYIDCRAPDPATPRAISGRRFAAGLRRAGRAVGLVGLPARAECAVADKAGARARDAGSQATHGRCGRARERASGQAPVRVVRFSRTCRRGAVPALLRLRCHGPLCRASGARPAAADQPRPRAAALRGSLISFSHNWPPCASPALQCVSGSPNAKGCT